MNAISARVRSAPISGIRVIRRRAPSRDSGAVGAGDAAAAGVPLKVAAEQPFTVPVN